MSFKERIVKYCTGKRRGNCSKCVFKIPCDRANNGTMPRFFTDAELSVMEREIVFRMKDLSEQLSAMANFMVDVSKDKLQETEEMLKR